MNVKELKEYLKDLPDDAEVFQYDPDEMNYYEPFAVKFEKAIVLGHDYRYSTCIDNDITSEYKVPIWYPIDESKDFACEVKKQQRWVYAEEGGIKRVADVSETFGIMKEEK